MLGLMAGLLVGNPWAIILLSAAGGFLGHRYDEQHALPPDTYEILSDFVPPRRPYSPDVEGPYIPDEEPPPPYEPLASDLCALFIEVARADGDVRREEVRAVRRYFEEVLGYGPESLEMVRGHLKAFLARAPGLEAALSSCEAQLPSDERYRLLDSLYELALADGPLQRSEREVLRRAARGLRVSEEDEQALLSLYLGDGQEHYAALGLTPDASDEEVKRAFRQLAAEYHPDKVSHHGRQAAEQAARRFQKVREAYEELRKLRGL